MNLIWLDDVTAIILNWILDEINQLYPSACSEEKDFEVVVAMSLCKIVWIAISQFLDYHRRVVGGEGMNGKNVLSAHACKYTQ